MILKRPGFKKYHFTDSFSYPVYTLQDKNSFLLFKTKAYHAHRVIHRFRKKYHIMRRGRV